MKKDSCFAIAIFILSMTIYTLTLCPTIYWQDSSAFASASYTLGIPFSPGFPVYILLGRIFSLFPAQNPAWPVNFMSAFWGSLSLAVLFLMVIQILRKNSSTNLSFGHSTIIASFILFFGFTTSFWSQTFRAEVYTLNFLFTLLLIFSLWKWSENREEDPARFARSARRARSWRFLALFAFLWGLSSANHSLLVVSLAPAFLIYIFLVDRRFFLKPVNLITSLLFGILGVSSYLFLLIRSQQNPSLNWGNPHNWENLFQVITKSDHWKEYLSPSNFSIWANLIQLISFTLSELFLPVILLAIWGTVTLYKKDKHFLTLLAGIFICNFLIVAWAAEFSIRNLDLFGYLLPSLLVLIVLAIFGSSALFESLLQLPRATNLRRYWPVWASLLLILPVIQLTRNFSANDHSHNSMAYQYGRQIIDSVPANSVILATEDNALLPLWYLTLVEKYRTDVVPLAWTALDNLAYLRQVKLRHPSLKIPFGTPTKSKWLETFHQLNPELPVFTQYVDFAPETESKLVPQGYLLKYSEVPNDFSFNAIDRQSEFLNRLYERLKPRTDLDLISREHFANFFFNTGVYYDRHSLGDLGIMNFLRALNIDETNHRYYTALGKAFLKSGRADLAQKFFQAALELNPYRDENQRYLSLCQDSLNRSQEQTLP
jgi:hypothetical protein